MFHIGQQVVCIVDLSEIMARRARGERYPLKNQVCTIRGFTTGVEAEGTQSGLGVHLVEIINRKQQFSNGFMETAFCSLAFRPVKKTDISIFTSMLSPNDSEKQMRLDESTKETRKSTDKRRSREGVPG